MCSVRVTGVRLSIVVLSILLLVIPGAYCQDRADRVLPPPGPLFPRLYPNPTGRDGMEDVIRAADILSGIKLPPNASSDTGSIEELRKIVRSPEVVRALELVRTGLKNQCSRHLQVPTGSRPWRRCETWLVFSPWSSGFCGLTENGRKHWLRSGICSN